jgi:competence protein ComFB
MVIISRDSLDYRVEGHSLGEIFNFNEQAVLETMREIYESDPSLCKCSLCIEDIFALALNSLPPRYIQATSMTEYEASPDYIGNDEVREKVATAVEKVSKRPNH